MKRFLSGLLVAAACVMTAAASAQVSTEAASRHSQPTAHGKPVEISMQRAGSSSVDLRQLPPGKIRKRERPEREGPESNPTEFPRSIPVQQQPLGPSGGPSAPAPSPLASFLGLDFNNWGAGHPPDTNGDVGPVYFIETVNTSIGIYNKATGARVAAFTFDTFMSQGSFGNLCDTDNFGDPVVLYDTFEDRWVISDFAFQLDAGQNVVNPPGNFQCIAVSKTGDPVAGGWNFYSINTTGGLGDYPKFGVWPDGVYMSVNMFDYVATGGYQNARLYAFNKAQMYAGAPSVQVVSFDAPADEFTLLPSNARLQTGTPPAGSPNYFSVVWNFLNVVSVYKFHVDWSNVSLSTLTGPFTSLTATNWSQLNTGTMANPSELVPSPASSLDTLYPRLMVQNQYSNIGGVESLWNSHTVGASGTTSAQAAVRFYQVKVTGGTVEANATQAFTFSPDVTVHRFMPSVEVDRAGNMAIGYSASSASLNPAMRYAGRLAGDAANSITQTETSLIEGTGSQNSTTRWGDYSSMSLDPDGCTFWMSNEYYAVTGVNWQTRIGAFKYPACTPVSSGSVQGTVTATAGGAPIAGATVSLGSRNTTTDAGGAYTFSAIPSGTYPTLSAAAAGYTASTTANVIVTDSATTTRDFSLADAPASACPVDTTQADFQLGVPTKVDLTTAPGSVTLTNAPSVDQQNATLGGFGVGITATAWGGQTFTPAVTGSLTQADINLFCSGCTGTTPNLTLSLRATSAGLPTGADLASGTITGFSNGASGYYSVAFAGGPTLNAGTQYALVIRPVSNPSAGTYALTRSGTQTQGANVYAAGARVSSSTSGASWSIPNTGGTSTDTGFKVFLATGYAASGDLVSSTKDANPASGLSAVWTTLSWGATTPANTLLRFQAAGSNSNFGPFNFVGPDGTAATFYTTSGSSLGQFTGKRYLQYRAFLSTTSSAATPVLNDATVCFSNAPTADLSIANSDGVATATPGGSVTYTITAANAGPSAALASNVVDTFPGTLTCSWTCAGSSGGTCAASGSGNINNPVNLPSGGSVTYTATCNIAASATGSLVNTATVTAPAGVADPTPGNNSATDTDTLAPSANLGITNTDGVTTATPGGSVSYTITASNAGPSNAPSSTVADTFPASLTCSWTCVGSGGGTCTASGSGNINNSVNLPSGGSVTYTASCNIAASATGSLSNTATVAVPAGVTDAAPGNNSATDTDTLALSANLGITNSDGVTTATPGGSVSYTIIASNAGPSNALASTVADTFPASLTCSWSCVGSGSGTCTASGSGNIDDSADLPSGGSATYTATCTIAADATGSLGNTATVTAPAGVVDSVPANNSAIDTDTLGVHADIAVTLSDSRSFAQAGDVLDYLIEVTNPAGPSVAVANVSDALPAALDSGSWTCTPSPDPGTICHDGTGNTLSDTATIPVGGKASYLYSAVVQSDNAGDLVNMASASLASGSDPSPANNSASDTDTIVIFRDGFDGGASLLAKVNAAGAAYVAVQMQVDAGLLQHLGIVPVDIASGRSPDGKRLFTLQVARFGSDVALRTLAMDASGTSQMSQWQTVDLAHHALEFAWQSASGGQSDGYVAAAGGGPPVLIDARVVPDRLTHLLITVEHEVPWLVLIDR